MDENGETNLGVVPSIGEDHYTPVPLPNEQREVLQNGVTESLLAKGPLRKR